MKLILLGDQELTIQGHRSGFEDYHYTHWLCLHNFTQLAVKYRNGTNKQFSFLRAMRSVPMIRFSQLTSTYCLTTLQTCNC